MKVFVLIVVIIGMFSCKKGNPLSPNIFGKWEVRRVYNGNIYPPDSTYKPGNGNILQLNSDSSFARYFQGQVTVNGIYHIRKNSFNINQAFANQAGFNNEIYFNNDTTFKWLINLTGDKLTTVPLVPDLPTTDYQRIQN